MALSVGLCQLYTNTSCNQLLLILLRIICNSDTDSVVMSFYILHWSHRYNNNIVSGSHSGKGGGGGGGGRLGGLQVAKADYFIHVSIVTIFPISHYSADTVRLYLHTVHLCCIQVLAQWIAVEYDYIYIVIWPHTCTVNVGPAKSEAALHTS